MSLFRLKHWPGQFDEVVSQHSGVRITPYLRLHEMKKTQIHVSPRLVLILSILIMQSGATFSCHIKNVFSALIISIQGILFYVITWFFPLSNISYIYIILMHNAQLYIYVYYLKCTGKIPGFCMEIESIKLKLVSLTDFYILFPERDTHFSTRLSWQPWYRVI